MSHGRHSSLGIDTAASHLVSVALCRPFVTLLMKKKRTCHIFDIHAGHTAYILGAVGCGDLSRPGPPGHDGKSSSIINEYVFPDVYMSIVIVGTVLINICGRNKEHTGFYSSGESLPVHWYSWIR